MFDSRSMSVQCSAVVLRNVPGNAPTSCAALPVTQGWGFQCQGDESLAAELIISITHWSPQLLPPSTRPHPLGYHHKCQPVWQWPPEWVGGEYVRRWEQWKRDDWSGNSGDTNVQSKDFLCLVPLPGCGCIFWGNWGAVFIPYSTARSELSLDQHVLAATKAFNVLFFFLFRVSSLGHKIQPI